MSFRNYIDVDLNNSKSIDKAIEFLEQFPERTQMAIDSALEELEYKIEDRLLTEIGNVGLSGSKIASSVQFYNYTNGFKVVVNSDYAKYVEFGTGLVGKTPSHPNVFFNGEAWEYNTIQNPKAHKGDGWWYPTTESDTNPAKKFDKKKGIWFGFTNGIPARPFMYRTWRYARNITTKTFNRHLERMMK